MKPGKERRAKSSSEQQSLVSVTARGSATVAWRELTDDTHESDQSLAEYIKNTTKLLTLITMSILTPTQIMDHQYVTVDLRMGVDDNSATSVKTATFPDGSLLVDQQGDILVTAENYHARFRNVLEYIDANLDDDLTLKKLGSVAAYSKYHFHRQFSDFFGIGVYRYVQLCRLKRASYQLAFRSHKIIDIALANGYSGPDSFSRAFKKNIGQSPSEFRNQPQWNHWYATYQPLSDLRSNHMKSAKHSLQVKIINFNDTKVAVFEHRGDKRMLGESIRKFIEWRKQNHLSRRVSATFNIVYNNPKDVAPEDYRLGLCAATDREVTDNQLGIICKIIPGGRCAVIRHIGSDDTLGETVKYLYTEWLPQSGEKLRDFPIYFQRVNMFPDVPENESVVDVFLPLRS